MSSTETPPTTSSDVPPLGDDVHDVADRIVRRYPVARSALLPLLHLVQSEQNHVTDEGIAFCAEKVGLTRAEVGAVATFYTMYKRQPVGDWLLSVCTNPPCKIAGGQEIFDGYVEELGGHADPETKVTVEHAECLGICDGAPVVQVNYEMFGPMTVAEGRQLLEACRRGDPPVSPWSGEKPPTFAEVERDLSGANDAWEDQLHMAALQQIAFENPPTYRTGETDLPVTHPGGDPAGVGGAWFREQAAGGAPTALGGPETPVDADAVAATALDGTVAQRVGEELMDDVASAVPGDVVAADVQQQAEPAPRLVEDVPEDAEGLTVEAAPDSSGAIADVRATQAPTRSAEDAGTARTEHDVDPAAAQPTEEPGDVEQEQVTDPPDEPLESEDTVDEPVQRADADEDGPLGVTAASETAVAGSVAAGAASERLDGSVGEDDDEDDEDGDAAETADADEQEES